MATAYPEAQRIYLVQLRGKEYKSMKSCKHSPVFGASALLALLSITNAGLVAQTATSGQLISPVRTLDLKATLPQGLGGNSLTVQGVRFRNGDLYFAISHSFKADGVTLIRTNSKGQLLSTYSPPKTPRYSRILMLVPTEHFMLSS